MAKATVKKMPTKQPQRKVPMRGEQMRKTGMGPFKAARPYEKK